MENIMEYILVGLIALFIGYVYGAAAMTLRLRRLLDDALDEADPAANKTLRKKQIPYLITEQHGDILYLFEKDSDTFMCQGSTLEELNAKLSEYKNIHIAFVEHNAKAIWFVNGEVTESPYEG